MIRMSKAILSPKDIKYIMLGYMNKFVKKKYNFVHAIDYVHTEKFYNTNYLVCSLMLEDAKRPTILIKIQHDNSVSAALGYGDEQIVLESARFGCRNTLAVVKSIIGEHYDNKYDDTISYFCDLKNVRECADYISQIHELLYSTPYIFTLPKTYTFLLSNNKTKIFPKEIAKLIANKLLFFKN